ncbi:MAG: prepilin-type N-terminal cleavage/methylation domain-containing protein [Deltaproteobacteria bacterium]|nr:MAG: prepilin-type N-terminal cleavage/methylation domain-containing protein [Deltaproteobacteria bacterium]
MSKKNIFKVNAVEGFALIEIMVVVAILSVAAAILVPRFLRNEIKKKQLECQQNLQALFTAEKEYFEKNGKYTEDITVLNWSPVGKNYEYQFIPMTPPSGYQFKCYGNIDNDPATDQTMINETGTLIQISDDSQK